MLETVANNLIKILSPKETIKGLNELGDKLIASSEHFKKNSDENLDLARQSISLIGETLKKLTRRDLKNIRPYNLTLRAEALCSSIKIGENGQEFAFHVQTSQIKSLYDELPQNKTPKKLTTLINNLSPSY